MNTKLWGITWRNKAGNKPEQEAKVSTSRDLLLSRKYAEKSITEAEGRIRVHQTFVKGNLHDRESANPEIRKAYTQDNKNLKPG